MDFLSLLTVMARRWLVVLPVLLFTLVAGLVFIGSPEERYTFAGSALLRVRSEADPSSMKSREIEPSIAATVLANAFEQPDVVRNLSADELNGSFTAAVDPSGSILTLTVASQSAEDAAETANTLLDLAPSLLESVVGPDVSASTRLARLGTPIPADAVEIDGEYVVTTYMSVLAPPNIRNPFPADNSTAQLLVELSRRTELPETVRETVPGGEFAVGLGGAIATPLVAIRATAGEPTDVALVYNVVVEQLEAQLVELQEGVGVPAADQTVLYPLVEPTLVERASSSVVRAAAGLALLGLAASAVLAIFVDARSKRRTERDLRETEWGLPDLGEDQVRSKEEDQDQSEQMVANS